MFQIDERIHSSSFILGDWPLSRVLLKNEKEYPWFVLVPRKNNIQELYQFDIEERKILMDEIYKLSNFMNDYFKPDKVNIGALGNVVSQFHIHVVGRRIDDALWPHSIWQMAYTPTVYNEEEVSPILKRLREKIYLLSKEFE